MKKYDISPIDYQRITELSSDIICITGMDGYFKYVNEACQSILGYTQTELTSSPFLDFIHPDDHVKVNVEVEKLINGKKTQNFESRYMHKDGSIRHISWSAVSIVDENKIYAIGRNISDRKQTEERLQESEEIFGSLIEQSPFAIQIHDTDGRLIKTNAALADLYNFSEETVSELYKTYNALEDDQAKRLGIMPYIEKTFGGEVTVFPPYEYNGLETTNNLDIDNQESINNWIQMKGFPIKDHTGKIAYISFIAEDVTNRIRSEIKLRNSEENFRSLIEQSPYSLQVFNINGKLLQANKSFSKLWGLSEEDTKDIIKNYNPLKDKELEKAGLLPLVKRAFNGELITLPLIEYDAPSMTTDLRLDHINTRKRWIKVKFYPIRNNKSEIIKIVDIEEDVTDVMESKADQEELKNSLAQAQKMEAIGQLAGGVAHDFNNMLSGILGCAEILSRKIAKDDELHKYTDLIIDSSMQAAELTKKLLTFSRKTESIKKVFNIHESITHTCELLQRSIDKSIVIKTIFDADLTTVYGEKSLIENSLLNLGINARDVMPQGGELTFTTRNITSNQINHISKSEIKEGQYIEIDVQDSGFGMSEETKVHLFEPFYTTKEIGKGTGLGLSIVYNTIKENNGFININSEIGLGSIFKIFLPVDIKKPLADLNNNSNLILGSGTILIADDEEIVRLVLKKILMDLGYTVLEAKDGEECISIYKEQNQNIDLVIIDAIMPKKNGKAVFYELKSINANLKAIMCSGYVMDISIKDLIKDGLSGFVQKPFKQLDLSKTLNDILS